MGANSAETPWDMAGDECFNRLLILFAASGTIKYGRGCAGCRSSELEEYDICTDTRISDFSGLPCSGVNRGGRKRSQKRRTSQKWDSPNLPIQLSKLFTKQDHVLLGMSATMSINGIEAVPNQHGPSDQESPHLDNFTAISDSNADHRKTIKVALQAIESFPQEISVEDTTLMVKRLEKAPATLAFDGRMSRASPLKT